MKHENFCLFPSLNSSDDPQNLSSFTAVDFLWKPREPQLMYYIEYF